MLGAELGEPEGLCVLDGDVLGNVLGAALGELDGDIVGFTLGMFDVTYLMHSQQKQDYRLSNIVKIQKKHLEADRMQFINILKCWLSF